MAWFSPPAAARCARHHSSHTLCRAPVAGSKPWPAHVHRERRRHSLPSGREGLQPTSRCTGLVAMPTTAPGDRRALASLRVVQKDLVYIVGLSMALCKEEVRGRTWSQGASAEKRGATTSSHLCSLPPCPGAQARHLLRQVRDHREGTCERAESRAGGVPAGPKRLTSARHVAPSPGCVVRLPLGRQQQPF